MILPQPLRDTADLDAWLRDLYASADVAAHLDARDDADRDAHNDDATESTRDDGALYHGRLPCDAVDAINPSIIAHRVILPQPIPAPALCEEPPPAWMDRCARGEYAHGRGEQGPATIRWRGVA